MHTWMHVRMNKFNLFREKMRNFREIENTKILQKNAKILRKKLCENFEKKIMRKFREKIKRKFREKN